MRIGTDAGTGERGCGAGCVQERFRMAAIPILGALGLENLEFEASPAA